MGIDKGETLIIYLAGPYRGDIQGNIEKARAIAVELWNAGHTVVTPHLMTAGLVDAGCTVSDDEFISRLLELVERCDAIVMMPGWENSQGSNLEYWHALTCVCEPYFWPDYPGSKTDKKEHLTNAD